MKKTLNCLFNGTIRPAEQYFPQSSDYRILSDQFMNHREHLSKKLSAADPSLVQELDSLLQEQLSLLSLDLQEMFIESFRLGAKLILETFE